MKRLKDPRVFLILAFLLIISVVPVIQLVNDALEGNGIRALDLFSQAPTAENLRSYEHSLESANWLAKLSRTWVLFAQFQWLNDGGEKVVVGKSGWYFYKPGLQYKLARRDLTKATSATNDPIRAIVNFRDQLAARGIRLIVMPVPDKESIYPDHLSSRAEFLRGILAPQTENLFTKLRAVDVEVIDLFKSFREARKQETSSSTEPLYLLQDTHWSPRGVKLAAQTAAHRLTELGWIKSGSVQYDERPVTVQRLGDVVRMLQVPAIERRLTPETVQCAQVVHHASGELYKDEADAEILVLGDSFTRIYQQDQPTAAGFVAHLAKELQRPLISLVNDGGGATLVREELSGRPAFLKGRKVVIWEFVERDIGLALKGWKPVKISIAAAPERATNVRNLAFPSLVPPRAWLQDLSLSPVAALPDFSVHRDHLPNYRAALPDRYQSPYW